MAFENTVEQTRSHCWILTGNYTFVADHDYVVCWLSHVIIVITLFSSYEIDLSSQHLII